LWLVVDASCGEAEGGGEEKRTRGDHR
jgi:hypothetical protein